MSRRLVVWLLVAFAAPLVADDLQKDRPQPPASTKEEPLKEEDETLATTNEEYSFNPLQAEKDLSVGNYYFKRGKYRAAVLRFRRATKWNDGFAEAWLRLGEAEEKQKDSGAAKEAYTKYLALSPDAKNASEIRKKIEKLK
jgi:tetratricopeptide (TPR) repeat protein